MKKRILSALLAVVMVFSLIPAAFAVDTKPTDCVIAVENVSARPGATVDVDVTVRNNPGILGMVLKVAYDGDALTLTGAANGDALAALNYTAPKRYRSSGTTFTWYGEDIAAEDIADGTVLTLTFTVSADAEEGTYPVTLSYEEGAIYDTELSYLEVALENGGVTVVSYKPGDVNDDERINSMDLTLIARYIADDCTTDPEGYNVSINASAANVNNDGRINAMDLTLIARYIADDCITDPEGYNVTLLPEGKVHTHTLTATPAAAATCTEDGNIAYWQCSECGKYFSDAAGKNEITLADTVIEATHNLTHYAYKEPTYTESGNKEYWECSACGKIFENEGCTIETTYDKILIAVLTTEESTIEYDLYGTDNYLRNCGVQNPNPDKFITSDGLVLKDLVGPEGYKFKGWKNSSGEFVNTVTAGTQSGYKVYAQWEEQGYVITYNVLKTPVESLIKITDDYDPYHFTVSKGKPDLPNPEMKNYVFLGWFDEEGNEVQSIPAGTAKDITLTPYYTSMRYLAKANTQTDAGFIVNDYEDNRIYYIAEIGTIHNIPLANLWDTPIMSRAGLDSTVTKTVSVSMSKTQANTVAEQLTKATTDSNTWTLSKDWNSTTQVNKEVAEEQTLTQEQATTQAMSSSGTISLTNSLGGKNSTTRTDGTTTLTYDTKEKTKGNSQELDVGIGGEIGLNAGVPLTNNGAGAKVNAHIDGKFEWHDETTTKTGTEKTEVHTKVKQNEMSWNSELSKSFTQQASTSTTVRNALSKAISEKYGYGESYAEGGSNSQSQQFTHSASESLNSSSTLTYSEQTVTTETQTFHANGNIEGKYMLVQAGTAHVFAVVGYDIATKSFFTYTYNVMDDVQYQYLDYSPLTSNFDDCQYSVLPFEVPGFVYDYVATMTAQTEGLSFRTNSETGTAVVTNYNGTDAEVSVPNYVVINNTAYRVTGISASAFAGKNISAIMLNDFINEIPAGAFESCTKLKDVIGNFTVIGNDAFSGCEALEDFCITEDVVSIGTNAFKNAQKIKAIVSNPEIISAVTNSGAQNITLDISAMESNNGLTIVIPEINHFELLGGNKTFTGLKIESKANATVLRQIRIINNRGIPLDVYSENLTLDTVYAQSESYVMMLHSNAVKISLISDSSLVSNSGNAIVCKNPEFLSVSVGSVDGYLRISGDIYLCGAIIGNEHLDLTGEIVLLSESEFDDYIRGIFIVTLDPNGGVLPEGVENTVEAYVGSPVGALPVPTREYYAFGGWYTERDGGEEIISAAAYDTVEDLTAFAHWIVNAYNVSWSEGTGYSIAVERVGSQYADAALGMLSSGSVVYYGDELSITYTADTGYSIVENGAESITVTGNVTEETIFASASVNSYTYNVVYRSSNGTNLGSTTITGEYGSSQTVAAPNKSGYNKPADQSILWDSTEAKTITFIYTPTSVSAKTIKNNAWWWKNGSYDYGVKYSVSVSFSERTANSVKATITWTNSITAQTYYGFGQYFNMTIGNASTGTQTIATASQWISQQQSANSITKTVTITITGLSATTTSVSYSATPSAQNNAACPDSFSGTLTIPAY